MDLSLTETERDLVDLCRQFATREIAPRAPGAWERAECPTDLLREMGQLGLLGMLIPAEWGGIGMSTVGFVAAMEQCSIREAALRLQQWFGVPEPMAWRVAGARSAPASIGKGELVREKERGNPPLSFVLTGVDHLHSYLWQRGIDQATAIGFGVGFYTGPGLMCGRIVIPIRNERGEIVAYAGRAPDGQMPKYKLPAGFRKALELFNLHRAAATGCHAVVVVEGYFDCLRVHQAGFPCVVGLMGSSVSPEQKRMLAQRFERVVLMLDGDVAGRTASQVIRADLAKSCRVVEVNVPDGAQPDQLPLTVIKSLLSGV